MIEDYSTSSIEKFTLEHYGLKGTVTEGIGYNDHNYILKTE